MYNRVDFSFLIIFYPVQFFLRFIFLKTISFKSIINNIVKIKNYQLVAIFSNFPSKFKNACCKNLKNNSAMWPLLHQFKFWNFS